MIQNLTSIRQSCAAEILKMYKAANAGHIGSSLSCLEILVDLTSHRMNKEDHVILSKGHAACALYVTLAKSGKLNPELLATFYKEGTSLAAHPPCSGQIPSIPFGTGSLGHGLSLATGLALSQRFTGKSFQVYAILSEGDCNEGSTWEAALFAGHHKLTNLTVIVDANGIQGIGHSKDILDMEPLNRKWEEFGFETVIAKNGNDFQSLSDSYDALGSKPEKPRCIVARTTKGHGVSYMQDKMEWHYRPMTDAQYDIALKEIGDSDA
jgi:transketolase